MAGAARGVPHFSCRLLFLGTIRIKYIVGFLLLLSFFELSGHQPAAGIANLGGVLLGYMYVSQVRKLTGLGSLLPRFRKPFRKKSALKVTYKQDKPIDRDKEVSYIDQEAIDLILDKVAEQAMKACPKKKNSNYFMLVSKYSLSLSMINESKHWLCVLN